MSLTKKQVTLEYDMYGEFIRHTRMNLNKLLYTLRCFQNIHNNANNDCSFKDIYVMVHTTVLELKQQGIKGIGPLAKYDIASAICRHHHINIHHVYIVGRGPKNAIRKLNLKTKTHKLTNSISLPYVSIDEIKESFQRLEHPLLESSNGDDYESFLCKWQKT